MNRALMVIAVLLPTSAYGDFVVAPGTMSSAGPVGNAGNSVYMHTYTGPDTVIGAGSFTGGLTGIDAETLGSEAQWNIRNTRYPASVGVNYQVTFVGNLEGTILIAADSGAGMVIKTGDVLRFETYESFDDGPGVDAVWTDAEFVFSDATVASLGLYITGLDILTSGGAPPFGTDTEVGLYRKDGTLVASNDDFGSSSGSGLINLVLSDGDYYLAVSPYNSLWANSIMGAGIDGIGVFDLSFDGIVVDSDSTVTRNMNWYGFTIHSPCTCLGDINGDGKKDGRDIRGFITCLTVGGSCPCADMDGLNNVTYDDAAPFIAAIMTGGACDPE